MMFQLINDYYTSFFDEAKKYEKLRNRIHILILMLMCSSIKAEGYILYAIALSGLILQLFVWYLKYCRNQSDFIAHRLQRIAMLIDAYNDKKEKHDFEISHMIGEASSWVHKKAKQKSEPFKITDKNIMLIFKIIGSQISNKSGKEEIPRKLFVQFKNILDKEYVEQNLFLEDLKKKFGKQLIEDYIETILKYTNLLESLKSIKNKGFRSEDDFIRYIGNMISEDCIKKNKEKILKYLQMPYQEKSLYLIKFQERQKLFKKKYFGEKETVTIKSESAEYDLPAHVIGSKKLFYMVQQNAYWNHHLFNDSFKYNLRLFFTISLFIVFVLFYSFPFLINDLSYSFVRIGLFLLSFIFSYEILDKALIWRSSSKAMLAIDNQLNSANPNCEDLVMLIYSHYCVSKVVTPAIPDKIYLNKKNSLNLGWSERINNFKKTFEKDEFIHKE